eukprot:GHVQ01025439.1.p1 GENE.GHVQ01025439.1~~GHVQ01025439.1.p1  ORF type:complete len:804 (+),score=122.80 GHVQ01025439.1:108-2519(+)
MGTYSPSPDSYASFSSSERSPSYNSSRRPSSCKPSPSPLTDMGEKGDAMEDNGLKVGMAEDSCNKASPSEVKSSSRASGSTCGRDDATADNLVGNRSSRNHICTSSTHEQGDPQPVITKEQVPDYSSPNYNLVHHVVPETAADAVTIASDTTTATRESCTDDAHVISPCLSDVTVPVATLPTLTSPESRDFELVKERVGGCVQEGAADARRGGEGEGREQEGAGKSAKGRTRGGADFCNVCMGVLGISSNTSLMVIAGLSDVYSTTAADPTSSIKTMGLSQSQAPPLLPSCSSASSSSSSSSFFSSSSGPTPPLPSPFRISSLSHLDPFFRLVFNPGTKRGFPCHFSRPFAFLADSVTSHNGSVELSIGCDSDSPAFRNQRSCSFVGGRKSNEVGRLSKPYPLGDLFLFDLCLAICMRLMEEIVITKRIKIISSSDLDSKHKTKKTTTSRVQGPTGSRQRTGEAGCCSSGVFATDPPIFAAVQIADNNITDKGFQFLSTLLCRFDIQLLHLRAHRNSLTDVSCKALGRVFAQMHQPPQEVHLSHNMITKVGLSHILEGLAVRKRRAMCKLLSVYDHYISQTTSFICVPITSNNGCSSVLGCISLKLEDQDNTTGQQQSSKRAREPENLLDGDSGGKNVFKSSCEFFTRCPRELARAFHRQRYPCYIRLEYNPLGQEASRLSRWLWDLDLPICYGVSAVQRGERCRVGRCGMARRFVDDEQRVLTAEWHSGYGKQGPECVLQHERDCGIVGEESKMKEGKKRTCLVKGGIVACLPILDVQTRNPKDMYATLTDRRNVRQDEART